MVQIAACPTREQLVRLNDDEITGDLAESLFDHIEDCERCALIYGDLEEPSDDPLRHLARMTDDDLEKARLAIEVDTLKETATSLWDKLSPSRPSSERQPSLAVPCQLGQYEVLRLIDSGGMGEVYEARHVRLKRPVAVKVILSYRQDDPASHQHFLKEMETAGQLEHPNLVRSYDAWEHDGCLFLAQELLIGNSLQTLVNRRGFGGVTEVIDALLGTCQALEQLHAQGFVHRDVKPANIMRLEDGTIKLIDYGLAIAADSGRSAMRHGAGTPGYMSPEQAHGGYSVDHRSDIYSAGRLLKYLMNKLEGPGDQGIESDTPAIIERLRTLAVSMTQFAPDDRPHTVSAVIDELRQLQLLVRSTEGVGSSSKVKTQESGPAPAFKPVEQSAAAEDPLPDSSVSGPIAVRQGSRMRSVWVVSFAVPLLLLGWGGYQLIFKTDRQTTVVVENHQPGDEIRITSENGQVRSVELGDPATFVVDAGTYQLSLVGPHGRRLNPASISVAGRDRLTVRVEDVPPADRGEPHESSDTAVQPFPLKTRLLPAGRFVMGAVDGDSDAQANELPRRTVEFSEPFRMSTFEITVGQFREFVESMGYRTEAEVSGRGGWKVDGETGGSEQVADLNWANPGYPISDQHPVTMVTYADALAFCDWLSKRDDRLYRLPTEAEWEYACRAGAPSIYPFDENSRDASVWSLHNVGDAPAPRPVGTRKPNAWGLHDMGGNVREWCIDWYTADAYQKPYEQHLAGPATGVSRVVRGGCFSDRDAGLRSSRRSHVTPTRAMNNQGFRVVEGWIPVAEPPPSPQKLPRQDQAMGAPAALSAPFSASEIEAARQQWSAFLGLPPTQIIGLASDPSYRLELLLIPPGTFEMGMPAGLEMMAGNKPEWAASSRPAHQVTITQPFYLSRYEVTQKQFRDVVGAGLTPVEGDGTRLPATQIMWTACVKYCERLTQLGRGVPVGAELRLPTEAEWEYACRAGTTTRFWIGDQIGPAQASLRIRGRQMRLESIDAFQPNPFGLFNMHGNVSEWCSDWFSPTFYGVSPVDDPAGSVSGTRRVIRGGGLSNPPFGATSYWRQSYEPNTRSRNIGLRPVLELPRRERR